MLPIWFTFKRSAFAACNRCLASQDAIESSVLYFLRQSDHPVPDSFLATPKMNKNESLTYHWLRWSGSHIIHHVPCVPGHTGSSLDLSLAFLKGDKCRIMPQASRGRDMQNRSLRFTVIASEGILEAVVTLLVLCHFMPLQPIMDQSLQNSNASGGIVLRLPAGRHQRSERFCPTLPLSRCMLPSHPAA